MKIIAYGSLMNQKSLEKTLERKSNLTKIIIPNYGRIFNAPFGEYSFLNLKEKQNELIEAVYFEINKSEIKKFDEREKGSELKEIIPGFFVFIWPTNYIKELPVLQSYINFCFKGAKESSIDFWIGTEIPDQIINDSESPFYF